MLFILQKLRKNRIVYKLQIITLSFRCGLRIGVGGAIQSGLRKEDVPELAKLISECINKGYSSDLDGRSRNFIKRIKKNGKLL